MQSLRRVIERKRTEYILEALGCSQEIERDSLKKIMIYR